MGGSPITSFTDGSVESDVCDAMYEDVARASLTNSRWRFATDQAVLNRLSAKPTGRWDTAYQLPANTLSVIALTVNDYPIGFDTYGDNVYANTTATDQVIADFTFRADEAYWPSYFTVAVEYAMAAVLAISVARDASLAQMMEQKAAMSMAQARNRDSQSQTTKRLDTSRFIAQRRS